jgi:CHAT domain-containing protein/Tfp pilus assembly protein PilF
MRTTLTLLIASLLIFNFGTVLSQTITKDTTLANSFFEKATGYYKDKNYDTAIEQFKEASLLYEKHQRWEKYLQSETQQGQCYLKKGFFEAGISAIKPATEKALKHIPETDILFVDSYNKLGFLYLNLAKYDSTLVYWKKALNIRKELLGENHLDVATSYNNIGNVYSEKGEYELASENLFKSLQIRKELLGENSFPVASCYNNIGNVYKDMNEYDMALEYYFKSLQIKIELFGENHPEVAGNYNNLGLVFDEKNEIERALDYHFKALKINKALFGENHTEVASSFNNLGNIYFDKNEFDLAFEYYSKSLQINKELFGENHTRVANSYNNLGLVYAEKKEYGLALDYHFKSLQINKELFGEDGISVGKCYNNIANVYYDKNENDLALDYHFKSLQIKKELFGENHTLVANSYNNIGNVYSKESRNDLALEYYFKSLKILKGLYGEKHTLMAINYNNVGKVYSKKAEYDLAIKYYQKAIASTLQNFNDTTNSYSLPDSKDYLSWDELLSALKAKAEIFSDLAKTMEDASHLKRLEQALKHYQACDTIITRVRKEISKKSDKIELGVIASEVYKGAIELNYELGILNYGLHPDKINNYYKNTFYFSERNKASVLLEALAGSDALKFAGIPKELLDKEHDLSLALASYTNLKNNAKNDSIATIWSDRLFKLNRIYDSLIVTFETDYPDYYRLKYNTTPVKIEEIQEVLNKKTALLSYFVLDSSLIIHAITKKGFNVYKADLMNGFAEKVERYSSAIQSSRKTSVTEYKELAYMFYLQLFPQEMLKNKDLRNIDNLIIIPDGTLATIPFESLLTEEYTKDFTIPTDKSYFSEMPYLVKKYEICYSYSATLFYTTFLKEKNENLEIKDLNDFIAIAPVFDDGNTAGTTQITTKLLADMDKIKQEGTITDRSFLKDGRYVNPLPGSLTEVESIFKMFEDKGLKAITKTHKSANEEFLKSGALREFNYVHFATHGFVNTEKPELSGILLAQDTGLVFDGYNDIYGNIEEQNDGILYQSEIYNLELNSDLVVLSACETGLGKIASGEGIIGLTRALLYAGTKNIVVSLWSVSDASTSQLMINFYADLLRTKRQNRFSKHLQKAKLELIEEGTYAHPFYWSPFILIGK